MFGKQTGLFLLSIVWVSNVLAQSGEMIWSSIIQEKIEVMRAVKNRAAEEFKKDPAVKTLYVSVPVVGGGFALYMVGKTLKVPSLQCVGAITCVSGTVVSLGAGSMAAVNKGTEDFKVRTAKTGYDSGFIQGYILGGVLSSVFPDLSYVQRVPMEKTMDKKFDEVVEVIIDGALSDDDIEDTIQKACKNLYGSLAEKTKEMIEDKSNAAWVVEFNKQYLSSESSFLNKCYDAMRKNLVVKSVVEENEKQNQEHKK